VNQQRRRASLEGAPIVFGRGGKSVDPEVDEIIVKEVDVRMLGELSQLCRNSGTDHSRTDWIRGWT